jgi:hypothetical protein
MAVAACGSGRAAPKERILILLELLRNFRRTLSRPSKTLRLVVGIARLVLQNALQMLHGYFLGYFFGDF